jgi:hypothetical protein
LVTDVLVRDKNIISRRRSRGRRKRQLSAEDTAEEDGNDNYQPKTQQRKRQKYYQPKTQQRKTEKYITWGFVIRIVH